MRLLTIQEVQARTSLGQTTVYRLLASGQLPSVKIGRSRRIRERDLDDFIESRLEIANPESAA